MSAKPDGVAPASEPRRALRASAAGGGEPLAKRPFGSDDYWNLRRITDVQTSAYNVTAFVVQSVSRERNQRLSAVSLLAADSTSPVCVSGSTFDAEPRWSPDGRTIVMSSAATDSDLTQLSLVDPRTHERHQVTHGSTAASAPAWSPSGRELCFVADLPTDELSVQAESDFYDCHATAARGAPLRRLRSLRSRVDGAGYRERCSQLFTLAVGEPGTAPQRLTDSRFDDVDPAWSPDGRWIAFISNRTNDPRIFSERNVWLIDVRSGELRQLTHGYWLAGSLSWSPDATLIACLGADGLHVPFSLRLWLIATDASGAVAAGDGIGAHLWPPGAPLWTALGERVMMAAAFGAAGELRAYDRRSQATTVLLRADTVFGSLQPLDDGNSFVAVASSPQSPSLLVTGSFGGGSLKTRVDVNASWLAEVDVAPTRRVHFKSADGFEIDGWLITPATGQPPYPGVLDVHYGPNAAWGPAFAFGAQALAGRGFATLLLNPRGSTGYGDAFAAAADYGGNDFADLVLGLDTLVAQSVLDGDRLGIMGLSYGGFMATWAITQTQRFRAAVSINGICNQLSWYLLSDTGLFFYKNAFGDPFASASSADAYWQHSPLAHVASARTPLLLLQSENDYRCPIDQGEQIFGALVALGQTVELIRFPNAAHDLTGTAAPLHAYLAGRMTLEWFERFVLADSARAADGSAIRR